MIYCLNNADKERKRKIEDGPSWQKHGQGNGHRPLLYQKKKFSHFQRKTTFKVCP